MYVTNQAYNLILSLILRAGILAMEGYRSTDQYIETKEGEWDWVTYYDKEIENLLIKGIKARFPNHKFLAEESTKNLTLTDDPTWIIDPIDGTANFVHKLPFFAINVAYAVNKEVQFGLTYAPALRELFTARKGRGAFLNARRIKCSNNTVPIKGFIVQEPLLVKGWANSNITAKRYLRTIPEFQGYRSFGSAAWNLAAVARGWVDAYTTDFLFPWDVAAGSILITEAGGYISHIDGSPFKLISGAINAGATKPLLDEVNLRRREADENPLYID